MTSQASGLQNITTRHLLTWLAPPALLLLLSILACAVDPTSTDGSSQNLDPATARRVAIARSAIAGQWTVTRVFTDRNDADRPLTAGVANWTLEVFEIEAPSLYQSGNLMYWRGALRAQSLCLVTKEGFEAQSDECNMLEPVAMGRCTGHNCKVYPEIEVEGDFDTETGIMRMNDHQADMVYVNPNQGSITLDINNDEELLIEDDTGSQTDRSCSGYCRWRVLVRGSKIEETFRDYEDDQQELTMTRFSRDVRTSDEVNDEEMPFLLTEQEEIEARLLGFWDMEIALKDVDDVEREFSAGILNYNLDIFEVERLDPTGLWSFKAGLQAKSTCLVPQSQIDAGTYECTTYEPVQNGSCSGADCTSRGEQGVEGTYDAFSGEVKFLSTDVGLFHLSEGQGYISIQTDLNAYEAAGVLSGSSLEGTRCTSRCRWTSRGSGAWDEEFPYRDGYGYILNLQR